MADAKKKKTPKKPVKPFIGYGTDIKAGKAITKSVKKKVASGVSDYRQANRESFKDVLSFKKSKKMIKQLQKQNAKKSK
jgi:hypothetical protein